MIFFAVIPSCLHPGTKITAPPRPVSALSPPADVPTTVVNFHQPGLSGALTHLAMFDIALGTCLAAAIVRVLTLHFLAHSLSSRAVAAGACVEKRRGSHGWNIRRA